MNIGKMQPTVGRQNIMRDKKADKHQTESVQTQDDRACLLKIAWLASIKTLSMEIM